MTTVRIATVSSLLTLALGVTACGGQAPVPGDQVLPGAWQQTDGIGSTLRATWRLQLTGDHRFTRTFTSVDLPATNQTVTGTWTAIDPPPPTWKEKIGLGADPVLAPAIALTLDYSLPQGTELPVGATVVQRDAPSMSASTAAPTLHVRETYQARVRAEEDSGTVLQLTSADQMREMVEGAAARSGGPVHLTPPSRLVRVAP